MEGPRPVHVDELDSLSELVDVVFTQDHKHSGMMFHHFPDLFSELNLESVYIYKDEDKIVSHVGMTIRWASLSGCTTRVACIGAVATYEEYRGRGLAGNLLKAACEKAHDDGADFMLISGDRSLYRRAGSRPVGLSYDVQLDADKLTALESPDVTVEEMREEDIPFCQSLYHAREAHFIRPLEDWQWFFECRSLLVQDATPMLVKRNGTPCAYLIATNGKKGQRCFIGEWAGDATAMAAALKPALQHLGRTDGQVLLPGTDQTLGGLLEETGFALKPKAENYTLLLLDFPRLMKRMRPYFERRVGLSAAKTLRFTQDGDTFTFAAGDQSLTVEGLGAAAELVFGVPGEDGPGGVLGHALPLPSLNYGINFI